MPSKQVTDREKSARAVVASTESHADDTASALQSVLAPHLKRGEHMPDTALLIKLVGRALAAANAALVTADAAHERELGDDVGPRDRRDAAAKAVRNAVVDVRDTVDSMYGAEALAKLSMSNAAPSDPSALATYARAAVDALRERRVELPAPKRRSFRIDRDALADEIAAHLDELDKAVRDVAREEREAEKTLGDKTRAMVENDHAFSRTAGWLSATFMLAGLDEIAARTRPSGRHPGQTAADTSDDGGQTPPTGK